MTTPRMDVWESEATGMTDGMQDEREGQRWLALMRVIRLGLILLVGGAVVGAFFGWFVN